MRKGSMVYESEFNTESSPTNLLQLKGCKNLCGVTLYTYKSMFLLKPIKGSPYTKQLWIDRHTARPTELSDSSEIPQGYNIQKDYSIFLGIITVLDNQYLMMVDEAGLVCTIGSHKIYTISSISFLAMEVEETTSSDKKKDLVTYLTTIKKLLTFGHYFSTTYDLTLSKQKNTQNSPPNRQFQWNYALYQSLIKFNIDPIWQVPLIQGYIGHFSANIDNIPLQYYLISRRSSLNSGISYSARGLDDDANVANFVETEQIIYYGNMCCSQLQVRGSVPVFWRQKGIQAIIKLDRNYELTNHVFLKHMKNLTDTYGHVICLNLMSKQRKDEQMIAEAFENHLKTNTIEAIGYEYFDFHQAIKNQKSENINVVLYKIQPALDSFSFLFEDTTTGNAESQQNGIIRTNCLDCLDRTNFMQSKIAVTALDLMMKRMGIKLTQVFGKEGFEELDIESKQQHPFIANFKTLWTENGEALSIHYTGAGSANSDVTKAGRRSLFGMLDQGMKSINRFYNGGFEEKLRQQCTDFILGKHNNNANLVNEAYELEIQAREKEFSTYSEVNIYVVTWNVAGCIPDSNLDLRALFDFKNNASPDIVVLGFQEIVELNATTVMSNQHQKPNIYLWKDCILNTLRKQDKYVTVSEIDLVGLLILIFAKEDCSRRIVQVETDKIKTGLAGTLGNKGAVVVKLNVDDTTFCFVNCHLVPSASNLEDRLNNLLDIHSRAFQQEDLGRRQKEKILNLDIKFLLGDTNFRLSSGNNARILVKDYQNFKSKGDDKKALEIIRTLQKYDQLQQVRENDKILQYYQEGKINFLPTYKYDRFSDQYDTSKKQRTPAWTDRILWSCEEQEVEQFFYDRAEYQISDHRPVVSYFRTLVKLIDKTKKELITKQVYEIEDNITKAESEKSKGVEIKGTE